MATPSSSHYHARTGTLGAARAGNTDAVEADLQTRVTALEAAVRAIQYLPAPVVKSFTGTAAQLATLAADMTIDVIGVAAGTYHGWRDCHITADRTARPLTIRPVGTVVFDAAADGTYGDAAFYLDGARHVTLGGGFRFQHYLLAQTGLFLLIGATDIAIGPSVYRNIAANAVSDGQSSHLFYVSRGCANIDIAVGDAALLRASDEPGASYGANGVHVYTGGTGAAVSGVTVHDGTIANAGWAVVLRNATTGATVRSVHATDCGHGVPAAMDFGADCTGTVSGSSTAASVGTPVVMGGLADGGGNSWA